MIKDRITNMILMEPQPFTNLALRIFFSNHDINVMGALSRYAALKIMLELDEIDIIAMELYDVNLNPLDGIFFIKENIAPILDVERQLIIITNVDCNFLIKEIIKLKPLVIVSKKDSLEEITKAINHAIDGRPYLSRRISDINNDNTIKSLSTAEMRVYYLLARDFTPKMISNELGIAYKTVQTHKINIMKKISARSHHELFNIINKYRII